MGDLSFCSSPCSSCYCQDSPMRWLKRWNDVSETISKIRIDVFSASSALSRSAAQQQKGEDEENGLSVGLSMHVYLAGPSTPVTLQSIFQRDHHSFSNYCCWQSGGAGKWAFRNVFILCNPYELGPSSNILGEPDTRILQRLGTEKHTLIKQSQLSWFCSDCNNCKQKFPFI